MVSGVVFLVLIGNFTTIRIVLILPQLLAKKKLAILGLFDSLVVSNIDVGGHHENSNLPLNG